MTLNSNGGDDDGARNGSGSGGETPTSSSANTLYKGWILTCLLMINFIILEFFKENYSKIVTNTNTIVSIKASSNLPIEC